MMNAHLLNSAMQLYELGRIPEALDLYNRILDSQPDDAQLLYLLGVANLQIGQTRQGMAFLQRSLAVVPGDAVAHNNIGLALRAFGQFEDALAICDRALAINPNFAHAWLNRGDVLVELKRLLDARASYDRALAIKPDYADAYCNRGLVLQALGRPQGALASCDHALAINLDHAQAHYNRGNILQELGRPQEALASYDRALAIRPDFADALCNRGVVLQELGRWDDALASYDHALAIRPDFAVAYTNRGNTMQELGRSDEALASFAKALVLNPDQPETYYNQGNVLRELGRLDEALTSYDRALALNANRAAVNYNRSFIELLTGDLQQGLALYESRKNLPSPIEARPYGQPLWTGSENLSGKTLYLYIEQGFGDTIQFYRYAHLARARGARVILAVQDRLVRLLQDASPDIEIVGDGAVPAHFDFHAPLMSLALAFGTTMNSIPAAVPYLRADPQRMQTWRQKIGAQGLKIGICWQGGTEIKGRSFAPALLAPIAGLPNVRLISLQKAFDGKQLASLPGSMTVETLDNLDNGADAFLDTASLLPLLDLIITADTSVAHVAGALGCPTWLALKHAADWRWFLDRNDSPWYPSLRLFRQPAPGDWASVFAQMHSMVKARTQ